MLKVLIYPTQPWLKNNTPYHFNPKDYYRVVIILGFNGKTKIYHTVVRIAYDLLPGHKLEYMYRFNGNPLSARMSRFMATPINDNFHKEVDAFLSDHIRKIVDKERQSKNLLSESEIEHLGLEQIERTRRQLDDDLRYWEKVSYSLLGTDRTRSFGRQMVLLTKGQINHFNKFLGQKVIETNMVTSKKFDN